MLWSRQMSRISDSQAMEQKLLLKQDKLWGPRKHKYVKLHLVPILGTHICWILLWYTLDTYFKYLVLQNFKNALGTSWIFLRYFFDTSKYEGEGCIFLCLFYEFSSLIFNFEVCDVDIFVRSMKYDLFIWIQ